jgi:tetratricopeptide (TPR) repeat protein
VFTTFRWWTIMLLVIAAVGAYAGNAASTAEGIFHRASAAPGDRVLQEQMLVAIDEDIAQDGRGPLAHYVRGWILSRLGRLDEAVTSYETATRLDPHFSDAYYNAGVILADQKRDREALIKFDAAVASDPKNVDAAYDAGQLYYNQRDFEHALSRWTQARDLAPSDFNIAKKRVQALNALGRDNAAREARDAVLALWKNSTDPAVRALTEYVIDQFDVGSAHVYAYETLQPAGNVYDLYTFKVMRSEDQLVGTVALQFGARSDAAMPYVIRGSRVRDHSSFTGSTFAQLPTYGELKPKIMEEVRRRILPTYVGNDAVIELGFGRDGSLETARTLAAPGSSVARAAAPTIPRHVDPAVMPRDQWAELLSTHPRDRHLWHLELRRVIRLGQRPDDRATDDSQAAVEFARANYHHLRGIAFRHLDRRDIALREFDLAETCAMQLWDSERCAAAADHCHDIRDSLRRTHTLKAYVYRDRNDPRGEWRELRAALKWAGAHNARDPLDNLRRWCEAGDRPRCALRALFRSLAISHRLGDAEWFEDAARSIDVTYARVFDDISWDRHTGTRRTDDPRDFADMYGIGIGRPMKYGMVSAEEDAATFTTLFMAQEQVELHRGKVARDVRCPYASLKELRANVDVEGYVRQQLVEKNFEPAAKYLFHVWVEDGFGAAAFRVTPTERQRNLVTFDEVRAQLESTPGLTVAPSTLRAIELFELGNRVAQRYFGH